MERSAFEKIDVSTSLDMTKCHSDRQGGLSFRPSEASGGILTDYHVHIGQWNKSYFFADRIFSALQENGVDECWFSSTTSCIYCKESKAAKADAEIFKNAPTTEELYENIRGEVKDALSAAREIGVQANALYWFVPDVVRAGIGIARTMEEVPYKGFKLHPRAQEWDLTRNDYKIADMVFAYAERWGLRVMIHTGASEDDSPRKFEPLIKAHPNCLVQLAQLKDIDAQEYMLKTYGNVVVDSSFAGEGDVDELLKRGVEPHRILWGSDMPVAYVWAEREKPQSAEPEKDDLIKSYGGLSMNKKETQ